MTIQWFECIPDDRGITSIAYDFNKTNDDLVKIAGYNGIIKFDVVFYKGSPYIVTLVSNRGYFGLSTHIGVNYSEFVRPIEVEKVLS